MVKYNLIFSKENYKWVIADLCLQTLPMHPQLQDSLKPQIHVSVEVDYAEFFRQQIQELRFKKICNRDFIQQSSETTNLNNTTYNFPSRKCNEIEFSKALLNLFKEFPGLSGEPLGFSLQSTMSKLLKPFRQAMHATFPFRDGFKSDLEAPMKGELSRSD